MRVEGWDGGRVRGSDGAREKGIGREMVVGSPRVCCGFGWSWGPRGLDEE